MRGRLSAFADNTVYNGNTPAYAGKTIRLPPPKDSRLKHPRVCGEDRRRNSLALSMSETPPRMRGRRPDAFVHGVHEGNTPAYAGKTEPFRIPGRMPQKHPRVCGEDVPSLVNSAIPLETPPRMRGRRYVHLTEVSLNRNTPAYAGKTSCYGMCVTDIVKHPRVCGEDLPCTRLRRRAWETPPRMRGRL